MGPRGNLPPVYIGKEKPPPLEREKKQKEIDMQSKQKNFSIESFGDAIGSKKIINYLQIGNKIHVNFNSKSDNKLGYFKVEIQQALSPLYFDNQKKLSCITSAISLIKILTAENQKNIYIYELIKDFYLLLDKDNWIKRYIFWELDLLKVLGYDLELKNLVEKDIIDNKKSIKIKKESMKKINFNHSWVVPYRKSENYIVSTCYFGQII